MTSQSPTSSQSKTGSFFGMNNILAGLIVAVVALPLCIAFAIASGASPMAGVVSGVVGGAIAAAFGSSRFQVSGPAAAFITVIAGMHRSGTSLVAKLLKSCGLYLGDPTAWLTPPTN